MKKREKKFKMLSLIFAVSAFALSGVSFAADKPLAFFPLDSKGKAVSKGKEAKIRTKTAFTDKDLKKWRHVAVTIDKDGNYTFYINGKLDGKGKLKITKIHKSRARFFIGARHVGYVPRDRNFDGKIDHVMVFERSLDAEELHELTGLK